MGTTSGRSDLSWRGGLAAVTLALALVAPRPLLAWPGTTASSMAIVEQPAGVDAVELEVSVVAEIADAEDLRRWVEDESAKAIAGSKSSSPRRGVVRIAVEGALYDYRVTLTAVRDGEPVGEAQTSACECSNEDLLGELRARLPAVMEQLVVRSAPPQETIVEPPPPPPPEQPIAPPSPVKRISAGEVVGISLLVVGVAGLATGSALAVREPKTWVDPERLENEPTREYRQAGLAVLASGAVVVSTGLVIYLLRRRGRIGQSNIEASPTGLGMRHAMGLQLFRRF